MAQRLDQRRNLQQHQARTAAAAKTKASGRALGGLVVTAMALIGCLMAAHALHVEQRQQQQWEQVR